MTSYLHGLHRHQTSAQWHISQTFTCPALAEDAQEGVQVSRRSVLRFLDPDEAKCATARLVLACYSVQRILTSKFEAREHSVCACALQS